jgi:hypothetical protein
VGLPRKKRAPVVALFFFLQLHLVQMSLLVYFGVRGLAEFVCTAAYQTWKLICCRRVTSLKNSQAHARLASAYVAPLPAASGGGRASSWRRSSCRRGAEQLQAGGGAAGGGELHFWKLIALLLLFFFKLLRGRLWCSAPRASLPWRYRVVPDDSRQCVVAGRC